VEYLIVDSGMSKPCGRSIWSPKIENAAPFSSSDSTNVEKDAVADATDVICVNEKRYVVKR
jgi:hypothetical protein